KNGISVVIKFDGERWTTSPTKPFTVLIFGGFLTGDNSIKIDSDSLGNALQIALEHYELKCVKV
ncbi:hypothetical protein, partial [Pseudomonas syringae]